jgi:hypothetical protein
VDASVWDAPLPVDVDLLLKVLLVLVVDEFHDGLPATGRDPGQPAPKTPPTQAGGQVLSKPDCVDGDSSPIPP